jgi:hypothetical protein
LALNHVNTVLLNNVTTTLTDGYYLFLLMQIGQRPTAKGVLLLMLITYLSFGTINLLFIQGMTVFNTITYSLACLFIVGGCIYYFLELFQQRESVDLLRQPAFWICTGLIFYFACTFPIEGSFNFMNALPRVILQNLFIIFILLNILLYLSFSIAFLCRLKTRKSMSSF